jgi:DNA-binding MarR family transcriptional regulator
MKKREAAPGRPGVPFLLAQVGAHAAQRFAERLEPLGLSPPQAGILRALRQASGMSQQELAALLGILPSRLVALLDELAGEGLIERQDNPEDRRSHALHLTARGQARLADLGRVAREHEAALCEALSAEEREQLGGLLQRIADQQGLRPGVHPGYARRGRSS